MNFRHLYVMNLMMKPAFGVEVRMGHHHGSYNKTTLHLFIILYLLQRWWNSVTWSQRYRVIRAIVFLLLFLFCLIKFWKQSSYYSMMVIFASTRLYLYLAQEHLFISVFLLFKSVWDKEVIVILFMFCQETSLLNLLKQNWT